MKLKKVFIKSGTLIGSVITEWANANKLEVIELVFDDGFGKAVDGLVIINQNSDESKDILDIRKVFDSTLKPVHRIDINGTLMVGVSNFSLWLERNGCKNVLFIGAENLKDNPNLVRYFESMEL